MKVCACANCPRWGTEAEKADCRKKKIKRQQQIPQFNKEAWDVVKDDLRPVLADLIMKGDWEKVADFWMRNRWTVEMAILGK